jgi:hypothetical protein
MASAMFVRVTRRLLNLATTDISRIGFSRRNKNPRRKNNMAYTKIGLRERIKNRLMAGSKGGDPGEWSARKAQMLGKEYKAAGGGYKGAKTEGQKSLTKWTKEEWGTKSGKPSTQGPNATGERYLPKAAREALTPKEYAATSRAKREGMKKGEQFVAQPKKIAAKTAKHR